MYLYDVCSSLFQDALAAWYGSDGMLRVIIHETPCKNWASEPVSPRNLELYFLLDSLSGVCQPYAVLQLACHSVGHKQMSQIRHFVWQYMIAGFMVFRLRPSQIGAEFHHATRKKHQVHVMSFP